MLLSTLLTGQAVSDFLHRTAVPPCVQPVITPSSRSMQEVPTKRKSS